MKLWCILFLGLLFVKLSGQSDSIVRREIGLNVGYLNYGSIDELFSPNIYSGATAASNLFFRNENKRTRFKVGFQYASMVRLPKNVSVPAYYNIISYDSQQVFAVESEDEFRSRKTYLLELKLSYYRNLNFHLLKNDFFGFGISNENSLVTRKIVNNIELISMSLNPGIYYELHLKNRISILFENYVTLFAMSMRAPYSVAVAQLTDSYNSDYYMNYVSENMQFDWLNTYLHTFSCIQIEKKFRNRLKISMNYRFAYFDVQKPRKLTSVTSAFGVGCSINLGKHGKD